MKCSGCEIRGLRSSVYALGGVVMPMGGPQFFWDEDGNHHVHDMDIRSQSYKCSNGHEWVSSASSACPQGDFPASSVSDSMSSADPPSVSHE